MPDIGGMAHEEHFREEIGLINKGVNCAVCDDVDGEDDNVNYYGEARDNYDYLWNRSKSQVNSEGNGDDASIREIEFGDIG